MGTNKLERFDGDLLGIEEEKFFQEHGRGPKVPTFRLGTSTTV